jgi:ferrochelatase
MVEGLRLRYMAIGGRSPLLEITERQCEALQVRLTEDGMKATVRPAMRYWHPYISDVIRQLHKEGYREMIALPLSPHFSLVSTRGYKAAVQSAVNSIGGGISWKFVDSWNMNPEFLRMWERLIAEGLCHDGKQRHVLFTAHSIPSKYLEMGDPYPGQLLGTCRALSQALRIERWGLAYQSAGRTKEPWLGPTVSEKLGELSQEGEKDILIAPIGFVADHLEVLYDLDIEAKAVARGLGLSLQRARMPNDDPLFIRALYFVIKSQLS